MVWKVRALLLSNVETFYSCVTSFVLIRSQMVYYVGNIDPCDCGRVGDCRKMNCTLGNRFVVKLFYAKVYTV